MYVPDILGGDFRRATLKVSSDRDGETVCTLVRAGEPAFNRSVLYLHGFCDYFFQREMAVEFQQHGFNFYALDLRRCGRSLRRGQTLGNIRDIREYYDDLDAALAVVRSETGRDTTFVGHSTGGLVLSMYLHNRPPDTAAALVLNSPFFAFNTKRSMQRMLPAVSLAARFFPDAKLNKGFSPNYGRSISAKGCGEWTFNEEWKPGAVKWITFSWIAAIHRAQRKLQRGLNLACPTLVMRSARSFKSRVWSEEFKRADAVLNVDDILKHSFALGKNVTNVAFENALHDLILSDAETRKKVYEYMFRWLN
ncbi:MAG: alpha/beta hydrolase [Prevotellaceae bacterium]|nr:alpha/beta hydrolase [Prevotellaceae bacterium]